MARLAVHTLPNEGGGWKNVTEGRDEIVITFNTQAEARAAARVRARRLRCEHIVYDLDGAVVARSSFGNHVYPRRGGDRAVDTGPIHQVVGPQPAAVFRTEQKS